MRRYNNYELLSNGFINWCVNLYLIGWYCFTFKSNVKLGIDAAFPVSGVIASRLLIVKWKQESLQKILGRGLELISLRTEWYDNGTISILVKRWVFFRYRYSILFKYIFEQHNSLCTHHCYRNLSWFVLLWNLNYFQATLWNCKLYFIFFIHVY
jgi:hypothetical protein